MKKKLLFFLTLLCAMVSVRAATTTIFQYNFTGSDVPTGLLTATGGSLSLGTTDDTKSWSTESAQYVDVEDGLKGGSKGLKAGSNALYITITLSSGDFKPGDKIEICGYNPWMVSSNGPRTGNVASEITTGSSKSDYKVGSAVIPDGFTSSNTLYLSRKNSTGTGFASIRITRETNNANINFIYDNAKNCGENVMILDGKEVTITGKMSVDFDPTITDQNTRNSYFEVEVTEGNSSLVQINGWWAPIGDYGKYCNFYILPKGTGTVTLTFKFKGKGDYSESSFTRTYTIVNDVSALSYEQSEIEIPVGGFKALNPLTVTPAEAYDVIDDKITYSVDYLQGASNTLLTVASDGTVTSGTEEYGYARITASYTNAAGSVLTASYRVRVRERTEKVFFKYGNDITIEQYPYAYFVNPFAHDTEHYTYISHQLSGDVSAVETSGSYDNLKLKVKGTGDVTLTINYYEGNAQTSQSYTLHILPAKDNKFVFYNSSYGNSSSESTAYKPEQKFVVSGVSMTLGGFVDEFGEGTSSTYGEARDYLKEPVTDASAIDNNNIQFITGSQNPKSEDGVNMGPWNEGRNDKISDFQGTNIPVYGNYYKFEPELDGELRINVLQTGIFRDEGNGYQYSNHSSDRVKIVRPFANRALYMIDEYGKIQTASSVQSHSTYNHPWVFSNGRNADQFDSNGNFIKDDDGKYLTANGYVAEFPGEGNYQIILTKQQCDEVSLQTYMQQYLDNETDFTLADDMTEAGIDYQNISTKTPVKIMRNSIGGYYTLTKSHTEYVFPMKAGKTYFVYVNASTDLGLNSFEYVTADTPRSELTIEGADNETNTTNHEAKSNVEATLSRTLYADQPNTLMLPFSVPDHMVQNVFGQGTEVFHFKGIGEDNKIHLVKHHHQMINADEPCIIIPKKSGDTWTFNYVTVTDQLSSLEYEPVSSNGYTFIGCFGQTTMNAGSYWVSANSKEGMEGIYVYRTTQVDWMSNTRAFFQASDGARPLSVSSLVIDNINGDATVIDTVSVFEDKATQHRGAFTLDGRRLDSENLSKGIYIVDGRKVVIK